MIGMSFQMKLQDLTVLTASNFHWKRTGKIRNLNMNSTSSKYFLTNKVLYLFVDIKYILFLLILLYPVITIDYRMWLIYPTILRLSILYASHKNLYFIFLVFLLILRIKFLLLILLYPVRWQKM